MLLVDSAGALLSALMLGVVLTTLEPLFGMPPAVLYPLAAIAAVFCLYSSLSFFLGGENWRPLLKGIAIANLLYCCLTIGLVIYLLEALTTLGILYFAAEVVVVVLLASLELRIATRRPQADRSD